MGGSSVLAALVEGGDCAHRAVQIGFLDGDDASNGPFSSLFRLKIKDEIVDGEVGFWAYPLI